jgi:hypothetical protein
MAYKWAKENEGTLPEFPPGEAKFITGDHRLDTRLYYFQQESGIQFTFDNSKRQNITGYAIADPAKWSWFLLRWR